MRNKIEGVNRSGGEVGETVHHLYMALLKKYISEKTFQGYRDRYKECVRMLNGLGKTLERKLPARERRWSVAEDPVTYGSEAELCPLGWPLKPET